jgi:glucokinase
MLKKGLIADIGGTNARFALCDENARVSDVNVLACGAYGNIDAAIKDYFKQVGVDAADVKYAAVDIAGPVANDEVSMTNCPWRFSKTALKREMNWLSFDLVNDFIAQALAVPLLKDDEKIKIGGGQARDGFPIAVVGPGTGLGASILVPSDNGWIAVAGEGGHSTIPALTDADERFLAVLRRMCGHVSAEKVASGGGLLNLYKAACVLNDVPAVLDEPADVSEKAVAGDAVCLEALQAMFRFLGVFAGNMALAAGALGGVYLAGGILPRKGVLDLFKKSDFRAAFEQKGRMTAFLTPVPTYVMTSENPAFTGLADLISKKMRATA